MKRLVSTIDLTKEEWLKFRKMGITGTDAGAIVGLNPYRSAFDVWQDKTSDQISDYDNEAMRQGRDLEAYVAQRFTEQTGLKVRNVNYICQNEEYPFLLADFDRMIVGENAGLECKTVSPYSADKWNEGQIPPWYEMQVQHYLAVSGCSHWYVAALIFGKDFIVRRVDRDEDLIRSLITVEERFWNENVKNGVMPEPDGTKDCSERIAEMYAKSNQEKTICLDKDYKKALDRRKEIDDLISKLETERESIDQKIKLEMEDAAYATTEGYRISWVSTDSQRLDTKRFKTEEPDLYKHYTVASSCRRFSVRNVA